MISPSNCIIWDIETAPLPDSYLDLICPEFEPPSNYKDEEKIAKNLAEQKAKWKERAALSPMTGQVLCIGYRDLDGSFQMIEGDEKEVLTKWCDLVSLYKAETLIGFNTHSFDIPFLVKRCWKHGIRPFMRPGVNLSRLENWVDLRLIWQMGDRQAEGGLDAIARYFGVGAKNGEGKDFYKLWQDEKPAALLYLQNEIEITARVAQTMGVVLP